MKDDKLPLTIEQASALYSMGARCRIVNKDVFDKHPDKHIQTLDKLREFWGLREIDSEDAISIEMCEQDLYNLLTWFELRESTDYETLDLHRYLQFITRLRFNLDLEKFSWDCQRRNMNGMNNELMKWY